MNLAALDDSGFDIQAETHAIAALATDFPKPFHELCEILNEIRIIDFELIQGGGGKVTTTQRLRRALTKRCWCKRKIEFKKIIDGTERAAVSCRLDCHLVRVTTKPARKPQLVLIPYLYSERFSQV